MALKLAIGVPYYGSAPAQFFRRLVALMQRPPCNLAFIDVIGDSLVPRARNHIAHRFLNTDNDALLFIDSDILFTPDHVARLISHDLDAHPVIAGLYPKKKQRLEWVLNTFTEDAQADPETGLLQAKYAGTGFLLIMRKVFETIAAKWPRRSYKPDSDEEQTGDRYDYFPVGVDRIILPIQAASGYLKKEEAWTFEDRYLSEDWAFCALARAAGFPIVADTKVQLKHFGACEYPIDLNQAMPDETKAALHTAHRMRDYLTSNTTIYDAPDQDVPGNQLIALQPLLDAMHGNTSNN